MKKLLALLLTVAMLLSMALATIPTSAATSVAPNENWTADKEGIYRISTPADLLAFSSFSSIEGYYVGKTVALTNDIDMTGIEWFMLDKFCGTFEGNGYAIKGLSLTGTGEVAMIKQLDSATFKNVRFLNANMVTTGNTAAVICRNTINNVRFENVYVHGTVSAGSTRASGFVGYTSAGQADNYYTVYFNNCVSDVTASGQRASGFISQTNAYSAAEFTDCAFIGDMSQAGRWSGAFVGLTRAAFDVTLTRCVVLGKLSNNTETGAFVFLDHQNDFGTDKVPGGEPGSADVLGNVKLVDSYTISNKIPVGEEGDYVWQTPIGAESTQNHDTLGGPRSYPFKLTIAYDGQTVGSYEATANDPMCNKKELIEAQFKYIAKEDTVNLTSENFKTEWTKLSTEDKWVVCGTETVAYGADKTVAKIMPAVTYQLYLGNSTVEMPYDETVDYEKIAAEEGGSADDGSNSSDPFGNDTTTKKDTTATTDAPTTDAKAADTEPAKDGGCGSVVGGSAIALMAVAAGAVAFSRKRKED